MTSLYASWMDFVNKMWSQMVRTSYETTRTIVGNSAYESLPLHYMGEQQIVPVSSIQIGDSVSSETSVEPWMLLYFAAMSGDWNPAHMHKHGSPPFNEPIAHGLLAGSFVSALLASKLPGPGSIYRSQTFDFHRPVKLGDCITTTVQVVDLKPPKNLIFLECYSINQRGLKVLDGKTVIYKKE